MIISRSILLRLRNLSDKIVEKIETQIWGPINFFFFFRKSYRLWDSAEKYCTTGQATDDNTAHLHCMLDTWGYTHTLGIRTPHFISTVSLVSSPGTHYRKSKSRYILKPHLAWNTSVRNDALQVPIFFQTSVFWLWTIHWRTSWLATNTFLIILTTGWMVRDRILVGTWF